MKLSPMAMKEYSAFPKGSDCLVSFPGYLLRAGFLLLCREAVGVFYSPSHMSQTNVGSPTFKSSIPKLTRSISYIHTYENPMVVQNFKIALSRAYIVSSKKRPFFSVMSLQRSTSFVFNYLYPFLAIACCHGVFLKDVTEKRVLFSELKMYALLKAI